MVGVKKNLISITLVFWLLISGCGSDKGEGNSAPTAKSSSFTTLAEKPVDITLTGADGDNDVLTYTITDKPANGELSGTVPELVYTPDPGFAGSDSFRFMVSDGSQNSTEAIVTIIVEAEVALSVTAHPENSLMAVARVESTSNTSVVIEVTSGSTETRRATGGDNGVIHDITVIGMRAQTDYSITAVATFADNSTVRSNTVAFTSGTLPDYVPDVTLTALTEQSTGGVTFFGTGSGQNAEPGTKVYWGVDEQGEIVWYLHGEYESASVPVVRVVEPGVLLIFLQNGVRLITTTGETLAEYTLGRFHHDAIFLPDGNIAMLASETLEKDDGTTISGDKIIEITPEGETVWEWSAFDHLDTARFPGALSLTTTQTGALDWSHSNALFYIEDEDALLLSVRSQSWVVKIDHRTGEILWIMGDAAGTDASYQYNDKILSLGSGTWMASQHAPLVTDNGEILLFDNRNESGGATSMSRVVKFAVDSSAMTAAQTWEAVAPKYAASLGDADELWNGNVLMCAGGPGSDTNARLVEVTPETPAETVWSVTIDTSIYRAERMAWDHFLVSAPTGEETD